MRLTLIGRPLGGAIVVLIGAGLLTRSGDVAQGIIQGLRISGSVLIPALFPFMVLCMYIVQTGAAGVISAPLVPLTKYIFRLPRDLGAVVLVSLIGGYPAGGKMISTLLEQGRLDTPTARRMLGFCFGPSPPFLITAVGAGMLLERRAVVILYAASVSASILTGLILSLRTPLPKENRAAAPPRGGAAAFVSAVTASSAAMINMCAFAILFSGVLYLIKGSSFPIWAAGMLHLSPEYVSVGIAGFLEVTSGSIQAAGLGGERALLLISLFSSWGGLSIIFQIMSLFERQRLRWTFFLAGRAIHGILAPGITLILHRALSPDMPVMMQSARPVIEQGGSGWLTALCLLAMCAMLTQRGSDNNHRIR